MANMGNPPTSPHRSMSESFAQMFSSVRRASLDIKVNRNEAGYDSIDRQQAPGEAYRSNRPWMSSLNPKTEEHEEDSGYSRQGASIQDHLKLRALEKDMSMLHILQFDRTMEWRMRTDMNRFDLLEECRKSVPPSNADKNGAKRRAQQSNLGVALQLRDIRCLQGVSEPALLVRRGAIIVSLEPVKAIVTCDSAYVVIPDGADELLVPLLERLRAGHKDQKVEMPFEFIALEALLVTLVNSHAREVKRRLQDCKVLLRSLKSGITNRMLNRILTLKKAVDEMYEVIIGAHEALEEVQQDDDLMELMYLTAQKEGKSRHHKSSHYNVMQAELLLDAYDIDFVSMAKQLMLMSKEVRCTQVAVLPG
jgi:hypothetical protein